MEAPGFVVDNGEACRLIPFPESAEKFAFFWGSVIVAQVSSSPLFLLSTLLRLELEQVSPLFSSDKVRLFGFERGMHYYLGLTLAQITKLKDQTHV